MCYGCWWEQGHPSDLPEGGEEIVALIQQIYDHPDGGVGGPLHVALDDWNIEDGFWEPYRPEDRPFAPDLMALAEQVAERMKALTEDHRAAVLAKAKGMY